MASFSDKADEVVGAAKQAAGDLAGDKELHAEGTVDKARAQAKQGVDAAADKAEDAVHVAADKAAEAKDVITDKAAEAKDVVTDKAAEAKDVITDKAAEAKDVIADKAAEAKDEFAHVADKAADTAQQLHLDDKRVLIVAAVAGITLTVLLRRARSKTRRSRLTATKRAAVSSVGHVLSR